MELVFYLFLNLYPLHKFLPVKPSYAIVLQNDTLHLLLTHRNITKSGISNSIFCDILSAKHGIFLSFADLLAIAMRTNQVVPSESSV